ncbi:uncharacterized protein LOC121376166 [Gigantopelta aegis]|uniref:uncharacterized protein LOC121376166 n=1 Tax=Gigantopelta aegis TaxID=1735272 RepID=UPI001B88C7B1|nr:uncharacterized protein LOC121376166 [Gigantopelta aegis]
MYDLELIDIFMMNFESSESSAQLHKLLRLYNLTTVTIDMLDVYINHTTEKMMVQSLTGYTGRASVLFHAQCAALGLQNVYFQYQNKIRENIQATVNNSRDFNISSPNPYPVPNNSQEIAYINNVLCLEFNSEYRSC